MYLGVQCYGNWGGKREIGVDVDGQFRIAVHVHMCYICVCMCNTYVTQRVYERFFTLNVKREMVVLENSP